MELTGNLRRRITLFSLMALVVPLVAFPYQFGLELLRPTFMNAMYEIVFYGLIVFFFNRQIRLMQMLQAAGTCLIFRLGLGAVFGFLVGLVYNMDFAVSMTLGVGSYIPAILLQAVATPFILKPVLSQGYSQGTGVKRSPAVVTRTTAPATEEAKTLPSMPARDRSAGRPAPSSRTEPAWSGRRLEKAPQPKAADTGKVAATSGHKNGFENAIQYLGEHGSVAIACVVDHEGLTLAQFSRGDMDVEEWAPLCESFVGSNSSILSRFELPHPDKVDLLLPDKRVIVTTEGGRSVLVVAERQSDEVLNIRINQAMEMISRYVAERYTEESEVKAEIAHVSST